MNDEKIEKLAKEIKIKPGVINDSRIITDAENALQRTVSARALAARLSLWRTIMRNPITKLAAAAVIIIAVVISLSVFNKSMPVAFGIEQVIEAYENIRFLHVKQFFPDGRLLGEYWIKSDELGRPVKARYYLPVTEDGIKLIVWTPEKTEHWAKSKYRLFICQTKRIEGRMQKILDQCQPKLVMKKLLEDQKTGDVTVETQKLKDKQIPAIITAIYKNEPKKEIYHVDQATDLITRIEFYNIKDGNEVLKNTTELCDYNVPIDEKMFSLKEEVPADVYVYDQVNQLIGMPQGDMNDEQAATETVRQFFQALVDKDYKKAGIIQNGMLEECAKREFGVVSIIRIISIGPAELQKNWVAHGFKVPCELEIINSYGQKTIWKPGVYVRPGDDEMHPDRWNITGGIDFDIANMKILSNEEIKKYQKMTPKEAAEAFFKACAEKNWDEFSKFLPVSANKKRMEQMERMKEQMKKHLGGLEIISIGEPFKKGEYPGWFVPYEIKFPPMEINLKLSNANPAGRFVVTGLYDSQLQPFMVRIKWSNWPEVLPDNDTYVKMSAEETVRSLLEAYLRQDWDEMRKFVPASFVEEWKSDFGNTTEKPPSFEITEEALWSAEHSAYYVKCRIEGLVKKWNLAIRNDNSANRYVFDGGI
jgi:hypothetical protein